MALCRSVNSWRFAAYSAGSFALRSSQLIEFASARNCCSLVWAIASQTLLILLVLLVHLLDQDLGIRRSLCGMVLGLLSGLIRVFPLTQRYLFSAVRRIDRDRHLVQVGNVYTQMLGQIGDGLNNLFFSLLLSLFLWLLFWLLLSLDFRLFRLFLSRFLYLFTLRF